jgi:hypothetical protein
MVTCDFYLFTSYIQGTTPLTLLIGPYTPLVTSLFVITSFCLSRGTPAPGYFKMYSYNPKVKKKNFLSLVQAECFGLLVGFHPSYSGGRLREYHLKEMLPQGFVLLLRFSLQTNIKITP